ncbi:MAG: hypothetical protein HON76_10485 [Candidatus Scalindua sp.]|mgnify:FL=1|jgi:hypothetical protein|nr:hypothetical protein [Candidatus Scalindua sp.]MBT5306773.1 hypothetical protein [Candidatus Scalindua sp.]MBT6051063.1 hypothetical protein [Candidatus Scalindua sp.]MBT6229400.1 hypothetical protein [Candidatus Scalindua sp.]MBT6562940.1 hypothetical protein [Candidatus Scalindua sp.]
MVKDTKDKIITGLIVGLVLAFVGELFSLRNSHYERKLYLLEKQADIASGASSAVTDAMNTLSMYEEFKRTSTGKPLDRKIEIRLNDSLSALSQSLSAVSIYFPPPASEEAMKLRAMFMGMDTDKITEKKLNELGKKAVIFATELRSQVKDGLDTK